MVWSGLSVFYGFTICSDQFLYKSIRESRVKQANERNDQELLKQLKLCYDFDVREIQFGHSNECIEKWIEKHLKRIYSRIQRKHFASVHTFLIPPLAKLVFEYLFMNKFSKICVACLDTGSFVIGVQLFKLNPNDIGPDDCNRMLETCQTWKSALEDCQQWCMSLANEIGKQSNLQVYFVPNNCNSCT
jgi:hypothetical protein